MGDSDKNGATTISPEENAAIIGAPAFFVNRFYLMAAGPVGRLTFGEQHTPGGQVQMRSAVTMSISDLIQLKDLLTSVLADVVNVDVTNG